MPGSSPTCAGVRRQSRREAGAEAPRERVLPGQRIRERGRSPERSPAAEWRVARGSSWRGTQDGPRPPLAEKMTAVHRALGPRDPGWPALPRWLSASWDHRAVTGRATSVPFLRGLPGRDRPSASSALAPRPGRHTEQPPFWGPHPRPPDQVKGQPLGDSYVCRASPHAQLSDGGFCSTGPEKLRLSEVAASRRSGSILRAGQVQS